MMRICSGTHPGLARERNEDSVAFDAATGVCILADGMGGHNAGEVASGMAAAFITSELHNWMSQAGKRASPVEIEAAMVRCVALANSAIHNMSRTNAHYAGMGTTLVLGVFQKDNLVLGHIGDSRCYRLRSGRFVQLTKDHSVLQEQIDCGLLTAQQDGGAGSPNMVTRALGVDGNVQTEINHCRVLPGDIYLMCSDGLSDMLGDEAIARILSGADSLEEKSAGLIGAANQAGGRDNITVLLAQATRAFGKHRLLASVRHAWRKLLAARRPG